MIDDYCGKRLYEDLRGRYEFDIRTALWREADLYGTNYQRFLAELIPGGEAQAKPSSSSTTTVREAT